MKLMVYGDSFVSRNETSDIRKKQYCWVEKVAGNLGLECINRGVSGSSSEFSMYKFVDDIENKRIGNKDFIIYVQTNHHRLYSSHFIHKQPNMSCSFIGLSKEKIESDFRYRYYEENYDHLVWYYNNLDQKINLLHHESFLHSIKNYAVSNPGVKILLLLLEPIPMPNNVMDHFGFLENLPKNLYFPNLPLNNVSLDEFTDTWDVIKWSNIVGYDPRVNHFSCPNLKILVDLTTDTFKNGCIENWSKDKFLTKIFSRVDTLEKYVDYCNKKMLWCYSDVVKSYKDIK